MRKTKKKFRSAKDVIAAIKYRTDEEQEALYDAEYRAGDYGNKENRRIRHEKHREFINKYADPKDHILVTGCGRGELVRMLVEDGYLTHGTEISEYVLANYLGDLDCFKLFYSELRTLYNDSYEVVVSNDVLEHLNNEFEAEDAIKHFARISTKYVLFSIGVGLKPQIFHPLVRPVGWWRSLVEKYLTIVGEDFFKNSQFFFCKVKD